MEKNAFDGTPGNLAIYVPCGAVDAYQEAWSSYRDQIKEAYIVDDQPGKNGTTPTASTLSEGNIWIIAIIAVVVIAGVATLVIVKKKTKPALASGTDNTDEE